MRLTLPSLSCAVLPFGGPLDRLTNSRRQPAHASEQGSERGAENSSKHPLPAAFASGVTPPVSPRRRYTERQSGFLKDSPPFGTVENAPATTLPAASSVSDSEGITTIVGSRNRRTTVSTLDIGGARLFRLR